MVSIKKILLLIILLGSLVAPQTINASVVSTVLYVKHDATGADDGSSWENAYPNLQDALAAAVSGDEIWVAAGIYYPDEGSGQTDNERESSFQLVSGVAIYGGFAGTERERTERDWETNITVLSGDLEQNDSNKDENGIISSTDDIVGDNAYHVVTGSGTDSSAIVDGLTINAGQANGGVNRLRRGGGMYNKVGSPTLSNVSITSNYADYGGGMYNYYSSYLTLSNVSITSNSALFYGGGMFNEYSSDVTLTNVSITSNFTSSYGGGAYNFESNNLTLTNVLLSGNSASYNGGALFNHNSSDLTLTNVTITNNSASNSGGAMFNNTISLTLTNVIIWNNQASGETASTSASMYNGLSTITISYSLIANSGGSDSWDSSLGTDGGNNIDTDPKFVMDGDLSTLTDGDYRLQIDSPAIDAGDNDAIGGTSTDLDGNSRLADVPSQVDTGNGTAPVVDMGAYETASP